MTNVFELRRIDPFTAPASAVKARLRRKFGWTAANLDDAVRDLQRMTPSLRPAFQIFWDTGKYDPELRAGEFTLGQLVAERFLPAAAFLALDQVLKDPVEATQWTRRNILRIRASISEQSRPKSNDKPATLPLPTW